MKLRSLLLASVLCLTAVQIKAHKKATEKGHERINTTKDQLIVRVQNSAGVTFDKVTATFRFYEQRKDFLGEKQTCGNDFIEGTLTVHNIEDGRGMDFDSRGVEYKGKKIAEHFGRKHYFVVLHKISAGRWHLPGTQVLLRTTRKTFKKGTQRELRFKIVTTKNRFGFPTYKIQPAQQTMDAR
jgi:hypothetical protein